MLHFTSIRLRAPAAAVTAVALAVLLAVTSGAQPTPPDSGVAGAWQKLLKLRTTASLLHTTAHPDDEHGALLAMLSRGEGARVSLLTLTRGESGDNAIGPELFDALGLIRTEELLLADRYYGVEQQYFGTVVDYGFSKRLDETIEKWGREQALRDVVGVIRTERPLVVVSRFQGNARDGHGNHSAAGLVTQEAFKAAGDPKLFPDQIEKGLRPWQPLKLYIGGVRPDEDWHVQVDTGRYDPVLGESYQSLARLGLSFQRSQTSGRFSPLPGPSIAYYRRLHSMVDAPVKEKGFFDGIATTIPGLFHALRRTAPAGAEALLTSADQDIRRALADFTITNPSAAAPALARALATVRQASRGLAADQDVTYMLGLKERQIMDAVHAVLGLSVTATAQPAGTPEATGPFGGGPPPMPPVVPGQTFEVRTVVVNRSPLMVTGIDVSLEAAEPWQIGGSQPPVDAAENQPIVRKFTVTVPAAARVSRPYFSRRTIQDTRYAIDDGSQLYRPASQPALEAVVRYSLAGVPFDVRRPVTRLEANLPYGNDARELTVLPALGVTLTPAYAIAPLAAASKSVRVKVEVVHNRDAAPDGSVRLAVPSGWKVAPSSHPLRFSRAGERALYDFAIDIPALQEGEYRIQAVATSGGREYREGYTTIRHRDLETRYLYRDATGMVRGVDVAVAPGLKVGYVMGVGDDVPSGLAQLGADVQLLGAQDLATGDLSRFDTIMTGTRAYAVRQDLKTYNRRLLDYVESGGNLIVLYNTQEFVPNEYAPFPAELPRNAEEVSEEDSPVELLAPDAAVFGSPNRITKADFQNWVEQRGSKFWSAWDSRYTPLIATWDRDQPPQRGGWLHARYGKGHYTYFAYAFHRQLPYGVPGAYRLLANLLSLNQPNAAGRQPR
jgi:LmbE family N-acetylglucosaminyl deacetylase